MELEYIHSLVYMDPSVDILAEGADGRSEEANQSFIFGQ